MKAEEAKKLILKEYEGLINTDPLEGNYVLVAKNGVLSSLRGSHADNFTASALVDSSDLEKVLDQLDYPGNFMQSLGQPTTSYRRDRSEGYVEELKEYKEEVELKAFSVQREDPEGPLILEVRRDFVYYYSLFERTDGTKIVFDDHRRRKDSVIVEDRQEVVPSLKVRKDYLLDYLTLRDEALLIGSYDGRRFETEDESTELRKTFVTTDTRASVFIGTMKTQENIVFGSLDMFKMVKPPSARSLGDYGAKRGVPPIKFKTSQGLVSAKEAVGQPQNIMKFLASAYFRSSVLRKYEEERGLSIDDSGGVHHGSDWGIFRGIKRVGDELLQVNLGDLVESIPPEELEHWLTFNIDPPSRIELEDLWKVKPMQQLLNDVKDMKECAEEVYLKACGMVGIAGDLLRSSSVYREKEKEIEYLRILKKVLTSRDSRDAFVSRLPVLNTWLVDSLELSISRACVSQFDDHLRFDDSGQELKSMKLFQRSLMLLSIFRKINYMRTTATLAEKVVETTRQYHTFRMGLDRASDSVSDELAQSYNALCSKFEIMPVINELRNSCAYTHVPNEADFRHALNKLGFATDNVDWLQVYRGIIERVLELFRYLCYEF